MPVRTRLDWRTILVGFAGAGIVLSILLWLVGIDGVVGQLRQAGLLAIAAMVGLVVLWQSAWGLCLHTVLRALGTPISRARAILVFVAATFAN
ncbi:putative flippase [Halapricum desulfuricans]|uniref:Putative flippase n=1 Tax=Halapricum desulfuricans TaxID=2841257 RepID=A0A897NL93_9EURY|nr:putative flippase [Halapricum desulfuricans]